MRCDIIIPVWSNIELTKECINHIFEHTDIPFSLIVIDNASDQDTARYLDSLAATKRATVIRNAKNEGFVKAVNQGLGISEAPYICIMNNDVIPAPGWLSRMIEFSRAHPDVGLINPQCDGHGEKPIAEHAAALKQRAGQYMEMNQCQGFCMLMPRRVFEKVGYMDESFGIGGFDDTDYSLRAHQAGFRCVAIGDAYVYHRQHGSFDRSGDRERWIARNEKILFKKWGPPLRFYVPVILEGSDWHNVFERSLLFSYGLAREWSWVHIEINSRISAGLSADSVRETLRRFGLAPHQNFKVTCHSLPRALFHLTLVFKLLERMKPRMARKRFDSVITPDERTAKRMAGIVRLLGLAQHQIPSDNEGDIVRRGQECAIRIRQEKRSRG